MSYIAILDTSITWCHSHNLRFHRVWITEWKNIYVSLRTSRFTSASDQSQSVCKTSNLLGPRLEATYSENTHTHMHTHTHTHTHTHHKQNDLSETPHLQRRQSSLWILSYTLLCVCGYEYMCSVCTCLFTFTSTTCKLIEDRNCVSTGTKLGPLHL